MCGGRKGVPQQPCQYLNKCIYYYLTTINTCQICNINIYGKPLIIGIALPFSITYQSLNQLHIQIILPFNFTLP